MVKREVVKVKKIDDNDFAVKKMYEHIIYSIFIATHCLYHFCTVIYYLLVQLMSNKAWVLIFSFSLYRDWAY